MSFSRLLLVFLEVGINEVLDLTSCVLLLKSVVTCLVPELLLCYSSHVCLSSH